MKTINQNRFYPFSWFYGVSEEFFLGRWEEDDAEQFEAQAFTSLKLLATSNKILAHPFNCTYLDSVFPFYLSSSLKVSVSLAPPLFSSFLKSEEEFSKSFSL